MTRSARHQRSIGVPLFAALALCACLLVVPSPLGHLPVPSLANAQIEGRFYPETGYTLAPQFVRFYDDNGGLALFGYPITEARTEGGYLVQWTERQRLEWRPENKGTPHEVLLGLLGRELTRGLDGPRFQPLKSAAPDETAPAAGTYFFKETGQMVSEPFLSYWKDNGGLAVFGYPISSRFTDDGLEVQWFERARFEYHPDNPDAHKVLLGRLGYSALEKRESLKYVLRVHDTPAPDSALKIGLAQGGESDDPAFFDNIRAPGFELGPGLVRIDNIYNHYGIVQRGPDGKVSYSWERFDRVLDGIVAMGKEPMICLSYMPETLSGNGGSRVSPPASYEEWAALVYATVRHVNVERGLGVRYWEVWNEPDQIGFWQASFQEYLTLYDTTVTAALAADPTVRIGGPAVARFSPEHLDEFMKHEASLGAKGRVDFLSWHSYGRSPDEIRRQIREAREIASRYPQFSPELMISEFNVLQGGSGDTSANGQTDTVQGAIALLSTIEGMQRERLDRALLFEMKDGQGPKRYWGRWGILTYDGYPKPIYYALKAYQLRPPGMLPVTVEQGPGDWTLGVMAFGDPSRATILLWYTGTSKAQVKIALPPRFDGIEFQATLFDEGNNNPAKYGDPTLQTWMRRDAGDLLFDVKPKSLVILTSP